MIPDHAQETQAGLETAPASRAGERFGGHIDLRLMSPYGLHDVRGLYSEGIVKPVLHGSEVEIAPAVEAAHDLHSRRDSIPGQLHDAEESVQHHAVQSAPGKIAGDAGLVVLQIGPRPVAR